jgi:cell division protein FtsB
VEKSTERDEIQKLKDDILSLKRLYREMIKKYNKHTHGKVMGFSTSEPNFGEKIYDGME